MFPWEAHLVHKHWVILVANENNDWGETWCINGLNYCQMNHHNDKEIRCHHYTLVCLKGFLNVGTYSNIIGSVKLKWLPYTLIPMGVVFAHSHLHGFVKCCWSIKSLKWRHTSTTGLKTAATRLFPQQFYTRHNVWTYHLENGWQGEWWKCIAFQWRSFTLRFRDMCLCIWKNTHWRKAIYN